MFLFYIYVFCFIRNGEKSERNHMNSNSKIFISPNHFLNFSPIDLKNARPDIARLRCRRKKRLMRICEVLEQIEVSKQDMDSQKDVYVTQNDSLNISLLQQRRK